MRLRKFYIRVASPNENPAERFKRETLEDVKRLKNGLPVEFSEFEIVITVPDVSWLAKLFRPERARLIQAVRTQRPDSIYQLAKFLGRAVSNVQLDVKELAELGVLELTMTNKSGQKRKRVRPSCNWDTLEIDMLNGA